MEYNFFSVVQSGNRINISAYVYPSKNKT